MKIKKKIILFPNNTIITLLNNYLLIKGPFNTFMIPLFKDNFYNLLYNFNRFDITYINNDFNRLTIYYYKKKNIFLINYFINLIKKYIEISSVGYLNILHL